MRFFKTLKLPDSNTFNELNFEISCTRLLLIKYTINLPTRAHPSIKTSMRELFVSLAID